MIEDVDHRKLIDYFTACIEAENRAQGTLRLDGSVLQLPRGERPPTEWTDLPDEPKTTKWLRDLRRSAERQTVNLGWPLVGAGDEVAPVFVIEAELDGQRIRAVSSTVSLSPAALRLAGFDSQEIDSLLLDFEALDDVSFDRLTSWTEQIGLAEQHGRHRIRPTTIVFAGDDSSAITYFLLRDLAALRRLDGRAVRDTALGGLLHERPETTTGSWILATLRCPPTSRRSAPSSAPSPSGSRS